MDYSKYNKNVLEKLNLIKFVCINESKLIVLNLIYINNSSNDNLDDF